MKGKHMLYIGGAAALVWLVSRVSGNLRTTLKNLQFELSGIRFRVTNIFKPEVIVRLNLFNPNDSAVPVTDFFGKIYSGTTLIADFNLGQPVTVAARQQTSVEVSAKVSAINLILKIIRKENMAALYVDGILKTAVADIPVKKTYDVRDAVGTVNKGNLLTMRRRFVAARRTGFKGGFLQHLKYQGRYPALYSRQ